MKNIFFFIIILLLVSSFSISSTKIICDKFSISHTFENGKLEMNLKTDLPDNTIIMVSVSRSHCEKGDDAEYPIEYFSEKSTVGNWKLKKTIFLNNKKWQEKLTRKNRQQSERGKKGRAFIKSKAAGASAAKNENAGAAKRGSLTFKDFFDGLGAKRRIQKNPKILETQILFVSSRTAHVYLEPSKFCAS